MWNRMHWFSVVLMSLALPAGLSAQDPAAADARPVEVMVVGVYHMANPGRDLHDAKSDDVLQPKHQEELEKIVHSINGFHPTKVGVEWNASVVADRYPKYLAGTLDPSRNEVVQLGFRLAKAAGAGVYGIDADGDFPWERLKHYADAYGFKQVVDDPTGTHLMNQLQQFIDTQGILSALQYMNSPEYRNQDNGFYRSLLRVGSGDDQPGADLVAAWQHRNLLICANLLQISKPGDRIVVFFGAGHEFLLRQCVEETPGLKLIEPSAYWSN